MSPIFGINHLVAWHSRQDSNISSKQFLWGLAGYCFSFLFFIESLELSKGLHRVGFPAMKFGDSNLDGSTSLAFIRYVDLGLVVLSCSLGVFLQAA